MGLPLLQSEMARVRGGNRSVVVLRDVAAMRPYHSVTAVLIVSIICDLTPREINVHDTSSTRTRYRICILESCTLYVLYDTTHVQRRRAG